MRAIPQRDEINRLILGRVSAAMALGVVPLPGLDMAALTAIQVEMLWRMSRAYGMPFSTDFGKKIVAVLLAGVLPGALAQDVSGLLRYVPVVGPSLNVLSAPLLNGAVTFAVGHAFARHFASGGTFLTLDAGRMAGEIREGLADFRAAARSQLKKKKKSSSPA